MGRSHQRGEVEASLAGKALKDCQRIFAAVHDAQDLADPLEPLLKLRPGKPSRPLEPHPPKDGGTHDRLPAQLNGRDAGEEFPEQWSERRLRRCA